MAEEVRGLAQRSAQSAKETADKIEIAIKSGEHGVIISERVARSFVVIVEKVRRVDELIGEIVTASKEQSQGLSQINTAVSQMDQVTQSNAGSAEETAAAAEELSAQSFTLKDTVGQLRQLVDGGTPSASTSSLTIIQPSSGFTVNSLRNSTTILPKRPGFAALRIVTRDDDILPSHTKN